MSVTSWEQREKGVSINRKAGLWPTETFCPVSKINTIPICRAGHYQMTVKTGWGVLKTAMACDH